MAAPLARRSEGLIVRSVGSETVVFDTRTDQVTCLDATTARVWEVLDGRRDVDALAAAADLPQEEVVVGLAKLADAGLLLEGAGLSRRALLRGASTAAAAAPLLTIMAPTPAFAQSPGGGSTRTVTGTQTGCSGVTGAQRTVQLTITATGFTGVTSGTYTVTYVRQNGNTATVSGSITFTAGSGTAVASLANVAPAPSGAQTVTIQITTGTGASAVTTSGTAFIASC